MICFCCLYNGSWSTFCVCKQSAGHKLSLCTRLLPFLQSTYTCSDLPLYCLVRLQFIVCQMHWSTVINRNTHHWSCVLLSRTLFVYCNSQIWNKLYCCIAIGARCLQCCCLTHDTSLVTFLPPCWFVSFNLTFLTGFAKGYVTATIGAASVKDKSRQSVKEKLLPGSSWIAQVTRTYPACHGDNMLTVTVLPQVHICGQTNLPEAG